MPAANHTMPYAVMNNASDRNRRLANVSEQTCRTGVPIAGNIIAAHISAEPPARFAVRIDGIEQRPAACGFATSRAHAAPLVASSGMRT